MEFVIVTGQMVLNVAPDIARTCAYAQDVQNFPASPVVGLRIAEAKQVLSALGLRFPTAEEAQHRQEAGFFTVLPRPDKGTDVFSIQWRMPLVETMPGQFASDPRSTVHFVQVENCL